MSEESPLNSLTRARSLRPTERELIETMLAGVGVKPGIEDQLSSVLVEDMQDSGMGSIRFMVAEQSERRFGKAVAQAEYVDEDGVLVSIAINVDEEDRLFEVDFWKVDFSPLKRYPRASDLKMLKMLPGTGTQSPFS